MGKYRDLNAGDIFPASWTDAIQEFICTMASANFVLDVAAAGNALTLPAAAGDGQVTLGIMGRWRYNVASVTSSAIPGATAAGLYSCYATAADNVFAGGDTDNTVYAFALDLRVSGTPSTAIYRKVADVAWNGFGITGVLPVVGRSNWEIPVGAELPWTGDGDPADSRFLLADGRLIASASYPVFDAQAGGKAIVGKTHKYNGGVDPGSGNVRIPDLRGRVSLGADNMGTAQGAASRLPNSNRVQGQSGGEERHLLTGAEMPAVVPQQDVGTWSLQGMFTVTSGSSPGNLARTSGSTISNGGGAAHNNLQPYEVENMIVRVK